MYDIIFVGLPNNKWKKLKQRFPTAKIASDFFTAQQTSMTKMFWVVWPDLEIRDDFDFSYQADAWSKDYIHVFKNGEHYDGVILCNKRVKVSKKEIDYRFFTNKKEIDIQASTPACYDIFNIETYEDYVNALETSNTEMFWVVWPDLDVDFDFNWYYSHHN